MTSNTVQAVLLVLCAAIMNAAYALPMKLNKKWEWEHSWFAFSILGVGVVPTIIALLTVPKLWSTYSLVSGGTLAAMVLFGASWGVSLVFFGLALTRLGLAITFAVCLGTSAAVGALTPLIAQHSNLIMTRQGGLIILGVVMIVSGILGSMLNLGLAYGGSIQRAAQQHGASLAMMSNAVWLPCLYAGFLPGAIYCYILMRKKNNVTQLRLPGTWYYWFAAASMGFLWYGSIILYSISTVKLGALGPSIGWPLFLASIVVASTVFGALTGEWARTGTRPIRTMIAGVSFLVLAIAILSYAGRA